MRDLFKDFTLPTPTAPIAIEKAVRIAIDGDYKWGDGWSKEDAAKWERVVYPALMEAGYKIASDKTTSMGCPHLMNPDIYSKMDLYMHPMEFEGYASDEDIKKVYEILEKDCSDCIYYLNIAYQRPVYDMTDGQYTQYLVDNSNLIVNHISEYMEAYTRGMNDKNYPERVIISEIGFDFARNCRVPRVGDSSGLFGNDVDIRFISNLYEISKNIGYFDMREKIADMEFDKDMDEMEY